MEIPLAETFVFFFRGTSNNPCFNFRIATVDLEDYSEHMIEVSTVIPGIFQCDRFTFEPVNK